MATFVTTDEFAELTSLVRKLLGDVNTLGSSVGELDTLVERINHLTDLKDVTITYITEGDVLQYSSDGTWHNITPAELGISIGGSGGTVDAEIVKALIKSEGSKLFLSKMYDDTATGMIAFTNGFTSNAMTFHKDGIQIGNFITGIVGGSGAKIDKDGRAEMTSLTLREFLEVPELRFNKIDVVSGELWNSIAFGTIESVDTVNLIVTLKLEEGEYSGIHVNDICRGIFNNFGGSIPDPGSTGSGLNEPISGVDDSGFETLYGFSTAYFTPVEILDQYGKKFRYSLKPGTTIHPLKAMKFAVYGNFIDKTRQNSAYSTRTFKRYLKDVNLWAIDYTNIASQFGLLDGLTIPGAPNEGQLTGNGAYVSNIYLTDAFIQFTPEQKDELAGQDAYQVSLDRETATLIVDNDLNIIEEYNLMGSLTFNIQVWKGATEMEHSDIVSEGHYFVEFEAVGVECSFTNNQFKILKVTNVNDMRIDIRVNCEGIVVVKKVIWLNYQLEGNSLWVTYNDNDALPELPTGDGSSYGWHRNWTSTAIWMSTKSSRRLDEGEWGDPVRFVGASVTGKDGQYTAFCYTNASTQPPTPTVSQIPPTDSTTTWYMYPPNRLNEKIYTWMTQATVYSDKTLSGWTTPIRLTGDSGEDGTDGAQFEFIYKLTSENKAPDKPANSQQDDYVPFGWTDSPQGVSKTYMYEWTCTRKKKPIKTSELGLWEEYSTPVLWSKWGEKGMDGDGYEYIFTRTADIDKVPLTPASAQLNEYIPTIANGGSRDYNWSDDPKGVSEQYKAEWTCTRTRKDSIWSNWSTPSLWSNWGEQGLPGGNYQYRWKVSPTKPTTTPSNDPSWVASYDDNEPLAEGLYVWQIQRFKNADGTFTDWGNIIRLTGVDGKDGEDGNSIEFVYTRNSDGKTPATPTSPNTSHHIPSGWTDHPSGVTAILTYEWVTQRTMDKATLTWSTWSTPGIWARYSERGKDGDGYEYIYRRFSTYQSASAVGPGGTYYPPMPSNIYQNDDYVPANYTDNPIGPNSSLVYEYVWTRKKENGTWASWKTGAMWSKWAEDGLPGEDGKPGDPGSTGQPGAPGVSFSIDPGSFSITNTKTGTYQPESATFRSYKHYQSNGSPALSLTPMYWECYGANGAELPGPGVGIEVAYSTGTSTSFTCNFTSKGKFEKYWIGCHPDNYPDSLGDPSAASLSFTVVSDGDSAESEYTISRHRGQYDASATYYYNTAFIADPNNYTSYLNYTSCYIRDFVQYQGATYFVKPMNSKFSNIAPTNTTYWVKSSHIALLTVNTLLADNAYLGDFHFSNKIFTSSNGKLSMNSSTGLLNCTAANITGNIIANSGTFNGTIYATNGKFSGEIDAKSGKIAGFTIEPNELTNSSSTATVRFYNSAKKQYASIGGNSISGITGITAMAKFENSYDDYNGGYNTGMIVGASGVSENEAIYITGGHISGAAFKTEIVSTNKTLSKKTMHYMCNNRADQTLVLTLPTMEPWDDGHVIKISRLTGNITSPDNRVQVHAGRSHHFDGSGKYIKDSYIYANGIVHGNNSRSISIPRASETATFTYVRDLNSGSGYYGCWVANGLLRW